MVEQNRISNSNQMSLEKRTTIFAKYTNSKPAGIQYTAQDLSLLHRDFLLYVDKHVPQDAAKISIEHLLNVNEMEKKFYQQAMSTVLHPVYGVFKEPMYGSANAQLYTLRRDGGTYRLESYGMTTGQSIVEVSDAAVEVGSTFVRFTSNNGNVVKLERTGEQHTVNQNTVPVWQLTILRNDRLRARLHLVSLQM